MNQRTCNRPQHRPNLKQRVLKLAARTLPLPKLQHKRRNRTNSLRQPRNQSRSNKNLYAHHRKLVGDLSLTPRFHRWQRLTIQHGPKRARRAHVVFDALAALQQQRKQVPVALTKELSRQRSTVRPHAHLA